MTQLLTKDTKEIDFQKILWWNYTEKWLKITQKFENWKWPLLSLTSNISASTWPNFKSKDSFEILRTCSFQNWPYVLNLAKFELRNCQKTNYKLFLWTQCTRCPKKSVNYYRVSQKKLALGNTLFMTSGDVFWTHLVFNDLTPLKSMVGLPLNVFHKIKSYFDPLNISKRQENS